MSDLSLSLRLTSPARPVWATYGVALTAILLATAINLALQPHGLAMPTTVFFIGVVVAIWYGGLGPAVAATVLSIAATVLLPFRFESTELALRVTVFGAGSILLGLFWRSMRRSREQLAEQAAQLQDQAMELELANQELTESVEAAQQSREMAEAAEQRYRLLFERNPAPMWVYDLESLRFLAVNDAAVSHYGFTRAEFLAMTLRDIRPPEDVPLLLESHREGASGFTNSGVFRHQTRDGSRISVDIRSHDLEFAGRAARLVLATDITERLRVQDALQATSEQLRSLVAASPLPILGFDAESTVLSWNQAAEQAFGWAAAEMVGRHVPCLGPDEAEESGAIQTRLLNGESVTGVEAVIKRRDGSLLPVRFFAAPVTGTDGTRTGFVAVYEDISERKRVEQALRSGEEQFREAQKMEAIGKLAGGVAHDFNNILTAIITNADLLLSGKRHRTPLASDVVQDLAEMRTAAQRGAALTQQLLAFSRRQVLEPRVLDLNEVIIQLEPMLRRLLGADIEIRTRLEGELGGIEADPTQLEQVVLNLAVNARDAMPDGGTLTIDTSEADLDASVSARDPELKPGTYVVLTVSDTGQGMDAATKARVFDPFFTTKARGTGLGLATVYGVVRQSGGWVTVYSEPAEGTIFRVYLPRVKPAAAAKPAEATTTAEATSGEGSILLVEDDKALRRALRRVLESAGYRVHEVTQGEEALRALRDGLAADLVLSDLIMPTLGGGELARALATSFAHIPVIIMSGYTEEKIQTLQLSHPRLLFLGKPFRAEALLAKVAEALKPTA